MKATAGLAGHREAADVAGPRCPRHESAVASLTIGIDLGGTKIEGALLRDDREVQHRERVPTAQEEGYEAILARIVGLVRDMEGGAGAAGLPLGIGTPGSLSARNGLLKNSNTQCLNGKPIRRDLENLLARPIRIENDANCFALAEARLGAGRDADLVFGVILGTGVGGGITIGGKIRTGPQHIAGEWGHHVIDAQGPPCYCGARGCVEALLSGPALAARHHAAGGVERDAIEIIAAARAGDPRACATFDAWLELFGRAMANLVNILDPDVVVLGGGLSQVEELYSRGRDAVTARIFNDELRTPIRRHELGDSAGVIGAALLASSSTNR